MAETNGYIEGSNGERIEIVDSAARESLKTKLPAPKTAKAGDYLRISAINEDGSMLVEAVSAPGVELPTEATFAHITLETAQTADGECGVIIHPEGTEDAPELTFYGMRGDEAVRLNNVADAVDDRSVPNLGQVKNLVQKNGNDSGQNSNSGLSPAAARLLITILRDCPTYHPQTANIDALEVLLTAGSTETPEQGVTENGSVLTIISGVTVEEDGDTLIIK